MRPGPRPHGPMQRLEGGAALLNSTHQLPQLQPPRLSVRKSPEHKSFARAVLARKRGGPIPGPMNPNESSFRCRCIRHGRVALIPGHATNSNFAINLCRLLHNRFEQPHDSWPDYSHRRSARQCPGSPSSSL